MYLCFGCLAALIGMLLGILLGFTALQTVVLNANQMFFIESVGSQLAFLPGVTLLVVAAGLVLGSWVGLTILKSMEQATACFYHQ